MTYYPLSQIKTNLYTNGNEYTISDVRVPYVGFYWQNSKGQLFTGKTPQDLPCQLLFPISTFSDTEFNASLLLKTRKAFNFNDPDPELAPKYTAKAGIIFEYDRIKPIFLETFLPYYSPTLPTQQDYQIGEFQRYFCKKTNEILYIEINQEQFDKLVGKDPQIEFSLYQPFTITWILTGDKQQVAKTNKNIVELASVRQKLPKFDQYLKFDYTKYFQ